MKLFIKTVYGLRYSNFDQVEYKEGYLEIYGGYNKRSRFVYLFNGKKLIYDFFQRPTSYNDQFITTINYLIKILKLCLKKQ